MGFHVLYGRGAHFASYGNRSSDGTFCSGIYTVGDTSLCIPIPFGSFGLTHMAISLKHDCFTMFCFHFSFATLMLVVKLSVTSSPP
jgi:hypothetical protein